MLYQEIDQSCTLCDTDYLPTYSQQLPARSNL